MGHDNIHNNNKHNNILYIVVCIVLVIAFGIGMIIGSGNTKDSSEVDTEPTVWELLDRTKTTQRSR